MTAPQDLTDERAAPAELTDELIDAHLSLAYASSVLTCEKWDHVVARRFFGLGAAVGAGLIDTAVPGAAAPLGIDKQGTVAIPPGDCTAPDCDCEPGWCRQRVPATFKAAAPLAATAQARREPTTHVTKEGRVMPYLNPMAMTEEDLALAKRVREVLSTAKVGEVCVLPPDLVAAMRDREIAQASTTHQPKEDGLGD